MRGKHDNQYTIEWRLSCNQVGGVSARHDFFAEVHACRDGFFQWQSGMSLFNVSFIVFATFTSVSAKRLYFINFFRIGDGTDRSENVRARIFLAWVSVTCRRFALLRYLGVSASQNFNRNDSTSNRHLTKLARRKSFRPRLQSQSERNYDRQHIARENNVISY